MSLLKYVDLAPYTIDIRREITFSMEKKKAIKIATATAIAASGIVAVAPAQPTEAATSLTKTISNARATMKKPYDRYVKSTQKLAGVNSVKADIVKAEKAQKDANAAIKKSKLTKKQKEQKYAQIKAYVKYITHAKNYVKGYEEGQGKRDSLTNLSVELQKAVDAKDVAAIEKQIPTLETAIKQVKKYIKDTVYGAKAEGLLYDRFTDPAAAVLNDAKRALEELKAVETKIESVSALDDANNYLQITFNQEVSVS